MAVPSSRKLRLMHVVLDLDAGGTQRLVIEMSKQLSKQARVNVCCLGHEGVWAHELSDLGLRVLALNRRPGFRPSLALEVARLARRHRVDVLHCHHYTPFVYGGLAAKLCPGVRLVYTEHGRASDAAPSRKRRAVNVFLSRLPGRFFAVSRNLREHMLAEGFPGNRVRVIFNGIDPGAAPDPGERTKARDLLALPAEALAIGTVARLDPVKDLATLVGAFTLLAADFPAAHLVLIGDGRERNRLEDVARKTGVESRIHFAGARDGARKLLPALDVYANSSVTEGVSVTLLEAMAACLPIVATHVGGTPEVVIPGQTGILCPARDPAALYKGLRRLAEDTALRADLGRAGRDRVESSFALQSMVDKYLSVYPTV
jgi:glycosyltransferase involved in cell wall biosynthesis